MAERTGSALLVDRGRPPVALVIEPLAAAAALREAGVTFDVARDGREALVKLGRGHYAVVLSDLEMPRPDGFGLVRAAAG